MSSYSFENETSIPNPQQKLWYETKKEQFKEEDSFERLPSLKVLDGEQKTIVILDNGTQKKTDYGIKVLFTVDDLGTKKSWWVGEKQGALLRPLVANSPVQGKTCVITRTGSKQKDTRYSLKFLT